MRSVMQPQPREPRLQALREILEGGTVCSQQELTEQLAALGFAVTQSSVCRDLRELGVAKVRGCYVLSAGASVTETDSLAALAPLVRSISAAGPNMMVVRCVPGGASRVGAGIDTAGWSEVVGTVAGDDTLFIATTGLRARKHVAQLLDSLLKKVAHD